MSLQSLSGRQGFGVREFDFATLALHTKHPPHLSAPMVGSQSSNWSANSNSYAGLLVDADSGSVLSSVSPVSGLVVRPWDVKLPVVNRLKKRRPVRELSVASRMATKRCMNTGIDQKISRSATASTPLKHRSSTHLSCSVQPLGLKKSMMQNTKSSIIMSCGMAISAKKMITKSTPTPTTVVIMPLSAKGRGHARVRLAAQVLVVGFELRVAY